MKSFKFSFIHEPYGMMIGKIQRKYIEENLINDVCVHLYLDPFYINTMYMESHIHTAMKILYFCLFIYRMYSPSCRQI